MNQAALHAARYDKDAVDMKDLDFAKDKIVMGPERKSIIIDNKNKEITAFHEGGHALVAYFTKGSKPINKATIVPRGDTLGHVSSYQMYIMIIIMQQHLSMDAFWISEIGLY